jgi:hypothetical protein
MGSSISRRWHWFDLDAIGAAYELFATDGNMC